MIGNGAKRKRSKAFLFLFFSCFSLRFVIGVGWFFCDFFFLGRSNVIVESRTAVAAALRKKAEKNRLPFVAAEGTPLAQGTAQRTEAAAAAAADGDVLAEGLAGEQVAVAAEAGGTERTDEAVAAVAQGTRVVVVVGPSPVEVVVAETAQRQPSCRRAERGCQALLPLPVAADVGDTWAVVVGAVGAVCCRGAAAGEGEVEAGQRTHLHRVVAADSGGGPAADVRQWRRRWVPKSSAGPCVPNWAAHWVEGLSVAAAAAAVAVGGGTHTAVVAAAAAASAVEVEQSRVVVEPGAAAVAAGA